MVLFHPFSSSLVPHALSVEALLLVLLHSAHYRLPQLWYKCICLSVGVFSSGAHDIEFEVKVKGCYLVCKCFQAMYVCVFVPLVPTAADQSRGHNWPESQPGGQPFPRSDIAFLDC